MVATHATRGNAISNIRFPREACAGWVRRSKGTHSETEPRELTVQPQAPHQEHQEARKRAKTAEFTQRDAGIEGTLAEGGG